MAVSVQPRGLKFQLRVTHALLAKPFFATFDTETEARNYGQQLAALLASGVVPVELISPEKGAPGSDPLVTQVVLDYLKNSPKLTASDKELLTVMLGELEGLRVSGVTFAWAADYVSKLKMQRRLTPGTIRKRVGALARVLDWRIAMTTAAGTAPMANSLRLLPNGYSTYTRAEAAQLEAQGLEARVDTQRDRRLNPGEDEAIRRVLAGHKRPDRERPWPTDPAISLLYGLIVDTGLRLKEALALRTDDVDLAKGVLKVRSSKQRPGMPPRPPRVVPIKGQLRAPLAEWCKDRVGLVFPFWDGTEEDARKASARVSARFSTLFAYAGVHDMTEHDLRHEATCRWLEHRRPDGRWTLSEVEVCKIMGWSGSAATRMLLRYASLRGEDLADRFA